MWLCVAVWLCVAMWLCGAVAAWLVLTRRMVNGRRRAYQVKPILELVPDDIDTPFVASGDEDFASDRSRSRSRSPSSRGSRSGSSRSRSRSSSRSRSRSRSSSRGSGRRRRRHQHPTGGRRDRGGKKGGRGQDKVSAGRGPAIDDAGAPLDEMEPEPIAPGMFVFLRNSRFQPSDESPACPRCVTCVAEWQNGRVVVHSVRPND